MNRVLFAIDRMTNTIQSKIASGAATEDSVEKMKSSLDMEVSEFCRFQELKSHAMLEGKLSQDEAQTIYGFLGETPDHFNGQPAAVKAVLTQIFAELLDKKIFFAIAGK